MDDVLSGDDLMDMFENTFFGDQNVAPTYTAPQPLNKFEIKTEAKDEPINSEREKAGTEYSQRYRIKEERMVVTRALNLPTLLDQASESIDEDDDGMGIKKQFAKQETPELDVFHRYEFNLNPQFLPILEKREDILRKIYDTKSNVIVLTASTGTGKSSQVPQYILEEEHKRGNNCNIIITQPRRIAAIGLAKRVALERKCGLGTLVGYQIGLDKQIDTNMNSDTRILYCTTGVLLQKLIREKSMQRYSHVILDEVHERDVQIDLLLVIVRRLLAARNPYVKVILMSATLNAEKFAAYFPGAANEPAPIMNLNIPRPYPIKIDYLTEKLRHLGVRRDIIDMQNPRISGEMFKVAIRMMEMILEKTKDSKFKPSFLVFLPGIQDINRFKDELYKPNPNIDIRKFYLSILHSLSGPAEHERAFDASLDFKIILATNIAESSVTLPGVRFVIDFCLTKYQQTDTVTKMTQLKLDWASKKSLDQRAGRVGRVDSGQVFRMIFEDQYEQLANETEPEIIRVPLESVILSVKKLDMGKPVAVLGLTLDPPPLHAIVDSILMLKEIGGLTRSTTKGILDTKDGVVTSAGRIMALLPIDIRLSKLILLGNVFNCLEESIIIGAGLSCRSIFNKYTTSSADKIEEFHQKLTHARGSASDPIAILNVYREWRKVLSNGLKGKREKMWCEQQMLDNKNLRNMHEVAVDLEERLRSFCLENSDSSTDRKYSGFLYKKKDVNPFSQSSIADEQFLTSQKLFLIKMCIAGAFYPNYFAFGGEPPGRDHYSELNNSNPCTTVYFKGMEPNRIGRIYERQVREHLFDNKVAEELHEMKVKFDTNSSKLQVEFKPLCFDDTCLVPGEIALGVYKATKLGKIEKNLSLQVMTTAKELEYALEKNIGACKNGKFEFHKRLLAKEYSIYPKSHQGLMKGEITNIVNCGKFFFMPENALQNVEKLQSLLDRPAALAKFRNKENLLQGSLVVIKWNGLIRRGKIIETPDDEDKTEEEVYKVCLIDIGLNVEVKFEDMYTGKGQTEEESKKVLEFIFELPPQCFECKLSKVFPSAIKCSLGWSTESTNLFKDFIENKECALVVDSFVDRIAYVQVLVNPVMTGQQENFGRYLLRLGYAQRCDDSYLCLLDQAKRKKPQEQDNHLEQIEDEITDDIQTYSEDLLTCKMKISGPYTVLEAKLENLSQFREFDISVEPSSVNSVLFDPSPNDGFKKVLIATSMSKREHGVTLHQTTIMPNLPGLACLLGLIFAPSVEVRSNVKMTRYTSILTGLGCDDKRKAHFGEHDCLIYIDVEFDQDDFDKINKLRREMSHLLNSRARFGSSKASNGICEMLHSIVTRERKLLGLNMECSGWDWTKPIECDRNAAEAYPPITTPERLKPLSEATKRDLKHHAKELQNLSKSTRDERITCQLCEETIETSTDLQLHVMKRLHKDRVSSLETL